MTMDQKQKQSLKVLAEELCRFDYDEIRSRIGPLETDALIELLNARSRKVGDSAFYCLAGRPDGKDAVINAVLQDRFTRKDSKVRAANFLAFRGCAYASAMRAYFHLLDDKDEESASNALFGIVFSQSKDHLSVLREKHDALESDSELRRKLETAIQAIEEQNPFLYSRYYSPEQAEKLWRIGNAKEKSEAANKAVER